MRRINLRVWRAIFLGLLVTVAGAGIFSAQARGPQSAGPAWNARASADLATALHKMHEVWGAGDIASLKEVVLGDDTLVTFELDPATHQPIRLASKRDLDKFVDAIVADQKKTNAVFRLESPVVNCKATDAMGVCTEECTVHVTTPQGIEQVHRLWSTATAVKQDGAWRWVQWHMSLAAPAQVFKNGKLVSAHK